MKKLLLISICAAMSFGAFAQVTYLADTAFTTDAGYGGAPASCAFTGGIVEGWEMNRSRGQWLSDVFSIPADSTWTFDTVIIYGLQKFSGTTSTFISCNLQLYNSAPGLGGTVIWGDTSTNVLVSTGFTGIYRVDTGAPSGGLTGTERPIMYLKLHLSPAPHLNGGTYWLSWSALGTLSDTGTTSSPPKVLPARINPPGQMGRQYYNGVWDSVVDDGQIEGFNMIIKAKAGIESVAKVTESNSLLNQNCPNPFTGSTKISFYVPEAGYAKISVYNTLGQLVSVPFDGYAISGEHQVTFNASNLPSGVYYYRLNTLASAVSKQMLLVR